MALIHLDGFDKYGAVNSNGTGVAALLTSGEWTSTSGSPSIVSPLSATGFALQLAASSGLQKTLGANYPRLIGGFRFSSNLGGTFALQFVDNVSNQSGFSVNSTGTLTMRNGIASSGTILGTGSVTITAGATNYLEFDVAFGNTANYQFWLNGVSILSGTGDTTTTANNTASRIEFSTGAGVTFVIDDFYLFDTTGTTNNAVLLTSPRIETQFPSADAAVQFAVGAAILGNSVGRTGAVSSVANGFRVQPFVPAVACTINAVAVLGGSASSATIVLRPVIYSDSAGAPGTLLSGGGTVTGVTADAITTMPLTTPQSLTAGTQYWVGFMTDIAVTNVFRGSSEITARTGTATFASGAPSTPPSTTAGQAGVTLWGKVSVTANNWYAAGQNPAQGTQSYVYDATVGHEDLYSFPALSAPPSAIYAVAVKGSLSKSDAGAKTASLRLKSGATDSAGSTASIAPGTSYGWASTFFPLDPNGNIAWTKTALDAAQAGVKVET
jgi:hypothetical protein